MDREYSIYIDLDQQPILVGRLWSRIRGQRESSTFEYDKSWLENTNAFAIDPALPLGVGSFHTIAGESLFGAMRDCSPDRWGRVLMRRFERHRATRENRNPRTLFEIDFLIMVNDESRQGALRFKESAEGPFLSANSQQKIPPLIDLPRLLSATEKVLNDSEEDDDLRLLLLPGSSLGGARAKASVKDTNGALCIAKFPQHDDDYNVVLWEAVALELARRAGISIPEFKLHLVNNKQVLLIKRFDRINSVSNKSPQRIPFLSAMTMLGAKDHEQHSYLEIVDVIRMHGASPVEDLKELWSRIVFNILISNVDDHLRNHGFLYSDNGGWRLSPAYDLNPVPADIRPKQLTTTIVPVDSSTTTELALSVASDFGLSNKQAKERLTTVQKVVFEWEKVAESYHLTPNEIKRMESAFC